MARDVGAAPTSSGLEPDAFADMLIPNILYFSILTCGWGGEIRTLTSRVRAVLPAVLETVFLPLEYTPIILNINKEIIFLFPRPHIQE